MLRIKLVFLAQFHSSHSSERLHGKSVDLTKVSSSTKYFRHFVRQFISPSLGTPVITHHFCAGRSLFWGGRRKVGGGDDLQEKDLSFL